MQQLQSIFLNNHTIQVFNTKENPLFNAHQICGLFYSQQKRINDLVINLKQYFQDEYQDNYDLLLDNNHLTTYGLRKVFEMQKQNKQENLKMLDIIEMQIMRLRKNKKPCKLPPQLIQLIMQYESFGGNRFWVLSKKLLNASSINRQIQIQLTVIDYKDDQLLLEKFKNNNIPVDIHYEQLIYMINNRQKLNKFTQDIFNTIDGFIKLCQYHSKNSIEYELQQNQLQERILQYNQQNINTEPVNTADFFIRRAGNNDWLLKSIQETRILHQLGLETYDGYDTMKNAKELISNHSSACYHCRFEYLRDKQENKQTLLYRGYEIIQYQDIVLIPYMFIQHLRNNGLVQQQIIKKPILSESQQIKDTFNKFEMFVEQAITTEIVTDKYWLNDTKDLNFDCSINVQIFREEFTNIGNTELSILLSSKFICVQIFNQTCPLCNQSTHMQSTLNFDEEENINEQIISDNVYDNYCCSSQITDICKMFEFDVVVLIDIDQNLGMMVCGFSQ